jgi:hypothetical protein
MPGHRHGASTGVRQANEAKAKQIPVIDRRYRNVGHMGETAVIDRRYRKT